MNKGFKLYNGNCLDVMKGFEESSVDAIVTDPPYGLSFMGKAWDYDVPRAEIWREALRVLKPGGHLLAFFGSRTYHRGVVQIEDAGFEIRDQIMWVFGSGFPKSLDVSKAIDKAAGAERPVVGSRKVTASDLGQSSGWNPLDTSSGLYEYTSPATDAARQWQGWGTALKPAHEPIVVARKPLVGTVAANVQAFGTGAINIDGCRIELNGDYKCKANGRPSQTGLGDNYDPTKANMADSVGRWPANLIHDGSEEVLAGFPETNVAASGPNRGEIGYHISVAGVRSGRSAFGASSGSAARFFYCAKASKADREDGNNHPTVKPMDLMRYLCRLVTPQGGVVLDPFTGSGSTGKAAILEGFRFIGVEMNPEYCAIAEARIQAAHETKKELLL